MIDYYSKRNLFIDDKIKKIHFDILNNYPVSLKSNYNFVKVFLTTLIPYPSKNIVSFNDMKDFIWLNFFDDLNYEKLKSFKIYLFLKLF